MKNILILISVVLATLISTAVSAATSNIWEPQHPVFYIDNTTLQITRNVSDNECEWVFNLHYGSTSAKVTPLNQFSVGLLFDDTNLPTNEGHYYGYASSFTGVVPVESSENVEWSGLALANNSDAWFSFKTDLMGVGYANHDARDHTYTPFWFEQPTPDAVPEPGSLMALGLGVVALFARRRNKK